MHGSSNWRDLGSFRSQQSCREPRKGQDRRPEISLYFFLPALKRLGWEDFANWKLGSISRDVCFFLSSAQEARSYWGRNLALTEKEGSKLGEEEQERSQGVGKVCSRKREEIHPKNVLMKAKTGCLDGIGTYPPWPRLNSGLLNSKYSATASQCPWKHNRS